MNAPTTIPNPTPEGFDTWTPAARRAWARQALEAEALAILDDLGAAMGRTPTAAQQRAYLADVRPALDTVLKERG